MNSKITLKCSLLGILITQPSCEKSPDSKAIGDTGSVQERKNITLSAESHAPPVAQQANKITLTPAEVEQFRTQLRDTLPSAFSIDERQRLRETFYRLALADFRAALESLRDVPPGANRSGLLSLLSDSIKDDAGKLQDFVGDLLASGFPEDWTHVTNILQKSDKSLPIEVVEGWLSASSWVSGLPPGSNKDSAIAQIVEYSASARDKEAVDKWIESISDPALKSSLRENYSPRSKATPSSTQGSDR